MNGKYVYKHYVVFLFKVFEYCVVPENIHTPPPPWKGLEFPGGGGSKAQENPGGGGVVSIYIIFSRPVPLFLYVKFFVCIFLTDPQTQTLILLTAQK